MMPSTRPSLRNSSPSNRVGMAGARNLMRIEATSRAAGTTRTTHGRVAGRILATRIMHGRVKSASMKVAGPKTIKADPF